MPDPVRPAFERYYVTTGFIPAEDGPMIAKGDTVYYDGTILWTEHDGLDDVVDVAIGNGWLTPMATELQGGDEPHPPLEDQDAFAAESARLQAQAIADHPDVSHTGTLLDWRKRALEAEAKLAEETT